MSIFVFVMLFSVIDFLDRIDNVVAEGTDFWTAASYFLYKIPVTLSLVLPIGMLVATLFTIGILAKNSELTAIRASGITVLWIARPVLLVGLGLSFVSLFLNELVVPHANRRVKEIYNIDIRQKDKSGGYSQSNLWWRNKDEFFSSSVFDSRSSTLHGVSVFALNSQFKPASRTEALEARWVDPILGWQMKGVTLYRFAPEGPVTRSKFTQLPLPIGDRPESFFNAEAEPTTMSFLALRKFIKRQSANGVAVAGYFADLYEKIAFPFFNVIIALVVLPFVMRSFRSGSLAASVVAALIIGFSYYAVHSISIALGRAEIWHPFLAAWMANIVMGVVGLVLILGAEAPS